MTIVSQHKGMLTIVQTNVETKKTFFKTSAFARRPKLHWWDNKMQSATTKPTLRGCQLTTFCFRQMREPRNLETYLLGRYNIKLMYHCQRQYIHTKNYDIPTYVALAAWHSGHRVRLQDRRSRVRISPGCKILRNLCIAIVYLRKINNIYLPMYIKISLSFTCIL
jgi:hypothetical protein